MERGVSEADCRAGAPAGAARSLLARQSRVTAQSNPEMKRRGQAPAPPGSVGSNSVQPDYSQVPVRCTSTPSSITVVMTQSSDERCDTAILARHPTTLNVITGAITPAPISSGPATCPTASTLNRQSEGRRACRLYGIWPTDLRSRLPRQMIGRQMTTYKTADDEYS